MGNVFGPRTRSEDSRSLVSFLNVYRDVNCSSGTQSFPSTGGVKIGNLRSMSDFVTPRFYEKSSKGAIINNPMARTDITVSCLGNSNETKSTAPSCASPLKYGYWAYNGPFGLAQILGGDFSTEIWHAPSQLVTPSEVDNLINLTSTNAWAKVRGNNADLAVDLSQIGMTIDMLRSPLKTARNAASAIVNRAADRVRRKSGKQLSKADVHSIMQMLEGTWLEMRFGVRPLIGSMESIAEILKTPLERMRRTARSGFTQEKVETSTSQVTVGGAIETYQRISNETVTVRAGILWEDEITLSRALGLDAQSIISAGWDLVPWSFVADWFANIGKALQALVPYLSQHPIASWVTTKREATETWQPVSTVALTGRSVTRDATASYHGKMVSVIRVPNVAYGGISLRPSALQSISGDLRIVDSFFLTSQIVRGKLLR